MSLYASTVPQFAKSLKQLEAWLTKAESEATSRKFDPAVLLSARLAPDQYPLLRQIQATCDAAKSAAAQLAGREVPKHPDTETTLAEVHARIATVLAYLETFAPADFEGAEARRITLSFLPGKYLTATDYVNELALPNFYFHLTTAYSILRHSGINVGKTDFIGGLTLHAS